METYKLAKLLKINYYGNLVAQCSEKARTYISPSKAQGTAWKMGKKKNTRARGVESSVIGLSLLGRTGSSHLYLGVWTTLAWLSWKPNKQDSEVAAKSVVIIALLTFLSRRWGMIQGQFPQGGPAFHSRWKLLLCLSTHPQVKSRGWFSFWVSCGEHLSYTWMNVSTRFLILSMQPYTGSQSTSAPKSTQESITNNKGNLEEATCFEEPFSNAD